MSEYEIVDIICDAVNPTLLLACFLAVGATGYRCKLYGLKLLSYLLWNLSWTYGFLFVDNTFSLFSSYGLDYSTHSAFAVSVIAVLLLASNHRLFLVGILVSYCVAMVFQKYHTVGDVLVSIGIMTPFLFGGCKVIGPRKNANDLQLDNG